MMKFLFILVVFSSVLFSHQLRENYLIIDYNTTTKLLTIDLEIETRLFENATIDDNKNEIISFKELRHHQEKLFKYVKEHILFTYHTKALDFNDASVTFHRYQDQTYMEIKKSFFDVELDDLKLHYDMFFELESNHKLLIHLAKKQDAILDAVHKDYVFVSSKMSQFKRFKVFVKEGVFHILDGIDHLLFVLMLLIPSIVKYSSVNGGIKHSLISLLKIITTFSIAHSTTLFIAGMGWYVPNTMIVESGIAFSIFVVAILNFFHKYNHVSYGIVFLFGLVHGFGFANVLEIAGVEDIFSFVVALFGFNLGVEIGQIGVILFAIPLLFLLMRFRCNGFVLQSIVFFTICISFVWFLQRVGLLSVAF